MGGHAILASSFEADVECIVSISAPVVAVPDELSRRITGRKLFVCADGDSAAPHVLRCFDAHAKPKTLLMFGGSEHSRAMFAAPYGAEAIARHRRLRSARALMPARVNPDVPGEPLLLRRTGKRLRAMRRKRGLTMAQLGADKRGRVYFERQYVWKMETGRVAPSLAALAHFARRLDITLSELLRGI